MSANRFQEAGPWSLLVAGAGSNLYVGSNLYAAVQADSQCLLIVGEDPVRKPMQRSWTLAFTMKMCRGAEESMLTCSR